MSPIVAMMIAPNCAEARPSTSAGLPSVFSRSGWLMFATPRDSSLQPWSETTNAIPARDETSRQSICKAPSRQGSESRADRERNRPLLRERERVERVDQTTAGRATRAPDADLGVEAAVVGPGLQVPANQGQGPVAERRHAAQPIRQGDFAQLHEARVLRRAVVRRQDVVDPSDAAAAPGPGARAVVVANGLRLLDRLVALIQLMREEVQ